jgi:hypothetical protein
MTGNLTFMKEVAYPYVREVAAFYASYLKRDGADGKYGVPFGCAQELCSGRQSGDKHPQKDDTIDLAYSRWIFSKVWKPRAFRSQFETLGIILPSQARDNHNRN